MNTWPNCPNGPHPGICAECPEAFPCAICSDVYVETDGDACADCNARLDAFIEAVGPELEAVFA